MAAIDKMYANSYKDYIEFKEWCKKQPPMVDKYRNKESICEYLYNYWREQDFKDMKSLPIFNAPYYIDAYVIRNCPLEFMQDEMKIHYGGYGPNFGEEATSYNKIKCGELYANPTSDYIYKVGKHCKCVKHPLYYYNRPFKAKNWSVDVDPPEGLPIMWFSEDTKTWDLSDEYVISRWKSSMCYVGTIRALMRKVRKWKLPIGAKIKVYGRYVGDDYEFIVTK